MRFCLLPRCDRIQYRLGWFVRYERISKKRVASNKYCTVDNVGIAQNVRNVLYHIMPMMKSSIKTI